MRPHLLIAVLAIAGALLAGCGGGDYPLDEDMAKPSRPSASAAY